MMPLPEDDFRKLDKICADGEMEHRHGQGSLLEALSFELRQG